MTRTSTITLRLLCIALAAQRAEAAMKCGSSECTALQCAANPSNCNVYLQGDYVELGVSYQASFGTTQSPPSGYNGAYSGRLGFAADYGKDGWNVQSRVRQVNGSTATCIHGQPYAGGTCDAATHPEDLGLGAAYSGDYFVPGSPVEGWSMQYREGSSSGTERSIYMKALVASQKPSGFTEMTPTYMAETSVGDERSMAWSGVDSAGNIEVSKVTKFDTKSLYFTTSVVVKNIGNKELHDLFYMRSVDPDQEQPQSGPYSTRNHVKYQPDDVNSTVTSNALRKSMALDMSSAALSKYRKAEGDMTALVVATGGAGSMTWACCPWTPTYEEGNKANRALYLGMGSVDKHARVCHYGFNEADPEQCFTDRAWQVYDYATPNVADEAVSLAFHFAFDAEGTADAPLGPGGSVEFSYAFILAEPDLVEAVADTTLLQIVSPAGTAAGAAQLFDVKLVTTGGKPPGGVEFKCGGVSVGTDATGANTIPGQVYNYRIAFDTDKCGAIAPGDGTKYLFHATAVIDGKTRTVGKLIDVKFQQMTLTWKTPSYDIAVGYPLPNKDYTVDPSGILEMENAAGSAATPGRVDFFRVMSFAGVALPTVKLACWCADAIKSTSPCATGTGNAANPKPCATGGNIRVAADLSELAGYLENQKMTLEARAYCVGTYVEDSITKTCSTTSTAYEGSLPIKFAEPNYAPTAEHNTSTYAYLGMLITVN